jgi:hypothetical protein
MVSYFWRTKRPTVNDTFPAKILYSSFPAKIFNLPGNDDTGGAAVVADREVPVVGHEGVLLAPEHDPHVRRVVFKQKRRYHQL